MDATTLALVWADICSLAEIPSRGARVVSTASGDVALFRTGDDAVFALDDRCPHKAGKLSQGIVHGHAVTCPLHNWIIDLQTGAAAAPDEGCTRTIPARIQDGRVQLALPPR